MTELSTREAGIQDKVVEFLVDALNDDVSLHTYHTLSSLLSEG